MRWFLFALQKYAVFSGRASRAEYWWFLLTTILLAMGLGLVDSFLGTWSEAGEVGLLSGLFVLAILVPSYAVGARRLHDIGRSGWWQLIYFIPIIGFIVLLFMFARAGDPMDNKYGPVPTYGALPRS